MALGVLLTQPIIQLFGNNGQPAVNGSVLTQVGGVNTATYQDSALTTPLPNPIPLNSRGEISTSNGVSVQCFLTPNTVYTFTLYDGPNGTGNQIWAASYVNGLQLSAATIGQALYPQTANELANSVTPSNYIYPPGDVRRYGADTTGAVDSTGAINNALLCNSQVYAIGGTYICSAPLTMQNGQSFYGDGPKTVLQFASAAINNINMIGITGAEVRNLKVVCTSLATGSTTVGAVYMLNATFCKVIRCEFSGMWGGGVYFDSGVQNCQIDGNYFHNFNQPVGNNFGDIMAYSAASTTNGPINNVIVNNQCFGGGNGFGISLQDPDTATTVSGYPRKNVIANNRVGPHQFYGILLYVNGAGGTPPFGDTNNQIIGNYVEGITGGGTNTDAGAGIYMVGAGIGGTVCSNNIIFNCCTATSTASLAPAGIGVSLVHTGCTRPAITGNTVSGMTQGHGILITSSLGGAVISGNTITMPSSNTGAGPGGASLLGRGIQINSSSSVNATGNDVQMFGTGQALYVFASQASCNDITVTGGNYVASSLAGALQSFFCTFASTFAVTRLSVCNVNFSNTSNTNPCMSLVGVNVGSITNVTTNNLGTSTGLLVNGSTALRFVGGFINSAGSVAVQTAGTCTGSFMARDVNWGQTGSASGAYMVNAGVGFNVEAAFTNVPNAGSWVVGDRAIHSGVTVGSPKAWARVTTGSANVLATDWITEGNL